MIVANVAVDVRDPIVVADVLVHEQKVSNGTIGRSRGFVHGKIA